MKSHPNPKKILLPSLALCAFFGVQSASAVVIYQHNFGGSASNTLNGVTLDTTYGALGGTTGATWLTSAARFRADGTTTSAGGTSAAYIPFSPVSGYIYNISVTVDATLIEHNDARFSMSLLAYSGTGSPGTGIGFTNTGDYVTYATIGSRPVSYSNPPNSYNFLTWTGARAGGGSHVNYSYAGPWTLSIVLNTTIADAWTFQLVGSNSVETFPLSPTGTIPNGTGLNYIMFNNHTQIAVTMSDFSVTAIPEASTVATLSLFALFSTGLRRRRI